MKDFEKHLENTLTQWINESEFENVKSDVTELIKASGAENFARQLLWEYMAHHDQPFNHSIEWPNFTLELSMRIWFDTEDKQYDLYVLPTDSRFDFQTDQLSTNDWLRSRGEDLKSPEFESCEEEQEPASIRFVKSSKYPGATYCFVPLLRWDENGYYDSTIGDVQKGLRKTLDSILWKRSDSAYKSVMIVPLGLEVLLHDMDDLIWIVWQELRSAGHRLSRDSKESVKGQTIRLAFGLPQVANSFLRVMLNEGELFNDPNAKDEPKPSDKTEVVIPMRITKTWRREYQSDFVAIRRSPEQWKKLQVDVPRMADDICTRLIHQAGPKDKTFQKFMNMETTDRVLRMLVARRVIVAYYEILKGKREDFKSLAIKLGYHSEDEVDKDGTKAANEAAFAVYISELGLFKTTLEAANEYKSLWSEEIEWLNSRKASPN